MQKALLKITYQTVSSVQTIL